ncbi:aminoglycoside phosphotransferase family protein [Gymnodinialimonas ceratoperidinii]|uniref:Phosphotransferase n=1 Tax=Gymnodinialimonas ceratoperidinii TaxID=2856823 RepID=A0A8F6YD85_9RHOB|nr:phosphotransferase [Gymnodinialimonas ceratoperidinii]QXT40165.1 phosphotransferase [Gymnodinialimonas ceratoperidinii]
MSHAAFLAAAGWGGAEATPLAGDASTRRYLRLSRDGRTAILMVAPVSTAAEQASYTAFRKICTHLRSLTLSAPEELHASPRDGLILMEDLGDISLSRLLESRPDEAREAYETAAALLQIVKRQNVPDLAAPDAEEMARMTALTFDFVENSDALRVKVLSGLAQALASHAPGPSVLSLRDVHADNLMWLPKRSAEARVGLLDFQDAMMLPDGYDLASLLDDPRRVVPEDWRCALIEAHSTPTRIATLSLQRNLRILGIFRRLSTSFGKPAYAAYLPRTRALVARAAAAVPELQGPVTELLDRTAHWVEP